MTTPPSLDERVTTLEYRVFEQIPATLAAMNHGMTRLYAETVANGEAIAGVRVEMAAMQTGIHGDMFALKAALDLQGDSLRKEIGVQAAALRADMTAFREAVSLVNLASVSARRPRSCVSNRSNRSLLTEAAPHATVAEGSPSRRSARPV